MTDLREDGALVDVERDRGVASFGYSWCDKSGHIPGGPIWMLSWLPKGYAPTREDRLLAVFFDTDGSWDEAGLGDSAPLPPLLAVVQKAVQEYLRDNPDEAAGHRKAKDYGY